MRTWGSLSPAYLLLPCTVWGVGAAFTCSSPRACVLQGKALEDWAQG